MRLGMFLSKREMRSSAGISRKLYLKLLVLVKWREEETWKPLPGSAKKLKLDFP